MTRLTPPSYPRTVTVQRLTLSGNYTVPVSELCRRIIFTVAAARDVDIASLTDPSQWIEILNDSASTNDVTVKNGVTTIGTVSPGSGETFGADSAGPVPPF